ncbi:MFS transporter, partial [Salmonella enterica]|uniref:MFS transporter n=1 Tax=Salmonella enterica TaxID=28901 RepID=UPI003D2DA956
GGAGALLDDLTLLLISRVVLGIAVAAVMTASSTFIGDLYTGDMRFKVMGWQASFMSFGGVVFLSAGGVLAKLDWRMPFA